MSVPVSGTRRPRGGGSLPDGTEVASYASYDQALAALEVLSNNDFEVENVSVVGTDLYSVERIIGRVTWARAVSQAVMNGAMFLIRRRRGDFYSQSQVVAGRYAVIISKAAGSDRIREAFDLLQKTEGNQMRPRRVRPVRESSGPTEYGSRPDEKPRFGVRLSQLPETDASATDAEHRDDESSQTDSQN